MMLNVYVAGSSDELERAGWAMDQVRAEGWAVASDWVAVIQASGGVANPADASPVKRAGWANLATAGIDKADALWLLAPEVGAGRGAFFELGYAVARFAARKPIVVSGPTRTCSIFSALGEELSTDRMAVTYLRGCFDEPSRCRSCGAAIIWCRTAAGKAMPVDEAPVDDGNIRIDGEGIARVLPEAERFGAGGRLFKSHFATCPQAPQHRRSR